MLAAFSTVASLSVLLSATGSIGVREAAWEKVFELGGNDRWISSVRAVGPDDWFVAGDWGVTRISKANVERRETPGTPILGLFLDGPTSMSAVGARELVLHFDGKAWTEEHLASQPRKKASRAEDELVAAFRLEGQGSSSIVAFGPHLALMRQPDATWANRSEAERYRLWSLGSMGPPNIARPPRCVPGAWFWLSGPSAWFTCQDGRAFTFQAGHVAPQGTQPRECRTLTAVASAQDQTYIVCANGTLWKTLGVSWQAVTPPKVKDTDYASISIVEHCVFLAGRRTVWRTCTR